MASSSAPRSTKKNTAAPVVDTKAAVSPSLKQGSLVDQELLVLERDDGKRHSRELSACLNEYAKQIDNLQEKNRRLEDEVGTYRSILSFDDHVTRDDPFFNDQTAEKLSNLYLQGNNFMIRLELERKEVARLNALIQSHESVLVRQKTKLYELAALDRNHAILLSRVRKMENDIDRRIVKMNEKLNHNRQLRETIDAHRTERARMDDIYTKISSETLLKRHKVARVSDEVEKLRQEVSEVEQELEDVRQEAEEWEMTCDRRAAVLLQELKEIAMHQKDVGELDDVEKYKFLGENDIMRNMSVAQENVLQSRAKHSRWKTGQTKVATDVMLTKYQENRTYIEKIHEVSGTKTVSEMIEAFNNQYPSPTTGCSCQICMLKQRKDSVDFQRMNRIEGLRSKLQFTKDQYKHKENANQELQAFLAALKPAIFLFHSRIGCSDLHNGGDMKKVLGEIEEQIVAVLQTYHAKVETARKDGAISEQTLASTNLSSATGLSPSKRNRRASAIPRATTDHANDGEAARLRSAAGAFSPSGGSSSSRATQYGVSTANMGGDGSKGLNVKTVKAMLSKQQPYRYAGLRPPHMSMEELRKKDNMEEEYPLTYHELKVKVWHNDPTQ
ncbi:hypothetical protein BBJ28_00001303 [Nothophytophthora sp. Chile5]|nr:hypothetical protein BBJ28_00001303 [Nothophytophthora sp. Chile5]